MLTFLSEYEAVKGYLSLADAGNMKLHEENREETIENQKKFLALNGIAHQDFRFADVVHGTNVLYVDRETELVISGIDALVTQEKNLYIGLTVADCFPAFFHDPVQGTIGVAHAGWRGTIKGIIPRTIEAMQRRGSKTTDIYIELGPGISQANFEFQYAEMIKEFGAYSQDKYIERGSSLDKIYIDLQAILMDQVELAGVPIKNMKYCSDCTFADEKFFSARRHQGDSHSAMLAVIGIEA